MEANTSAQGWSTGDYWNAAGGRRHYNVLRTLGASERQAKVIDLVTMHRHGDGAQAKIARELCV